MNERIDEWWNQCECMVLRGEGGSFYSLRRSVPTKIKKKTCGHRLLEDKIESPTKAHLDESPSGFGRPQMALPQAHLPLACWQVGSGLIPCVHLAWHTRFVWFVGPFLSEMQVMIFYAFLVRLLVFSFVFHLWVPADHNSPKLAELIS